MSSVPLLSLVESVPLLSLVVGWRWKEEREDWFNAAVISTVPEDLLPKKALSDMGGVTGRKASIVRMKDEKGKVGRVSVRRGSDLKIIPMG